MYFALDGEPDLWRAVKLDNDRRGYGYIRYKNNSEAFLKDKLKFLALKNITIIPFLEEGYFLQDIQINKYKKKLRNTSTSTSFNSKNKKPMEENEKNEEVEYESDTIISVINNLKGQRLQSSYNIVSDEDKLPEEKKNSINYAIKYGPS